LTGQYIPFAKIAGNAGCADVIFVHGLTGNPVTTWTSVGATEPEGDYWPNWLATDLPYVNFYTLGYPASLFAQWAKKEMTLYERAKHSLELLAGYELGKSPLIFVCHSLGGLLVKQLLRTARESSEEAWHRIADSCVAVLFLATPHSGSSLANLLYAFSGCFSSHHVEKLKTDTSDLDELNESFRVLCHLQKLEVTVYYEMYKTGKFAIVVDKESADPGLSGVMPIPVDASHTNICLPENRHSPIYVSIRHRLKDLVQQPQVSETPSSKVFEGDDLESLSLSDRRDLQTKMIAADREHEYPFANDSQSRFARSFVKSGLKTAATRLHMDLLAEIEQRFQSLIFHPLICKDADNSIIATAIQTQIVEPLSIKYAANEASAKTIMNALYFLTERCHVRWDKP
jgi:protein SERAC1